MKESVEVSAAGVGLWRNEKFRLEVGVKQFDVTKILCSIYSYFGGAFYSKTCPLPYYILFQMI